MSANWKTQQWPQDWKRSVFIPVPKKGYAKECSNYRTIILISHTGKVMLKIFQARLQQHMNRELPHVQASFRKRGIFQEISIETCILSRVTQITSPGWMHETSARTWCTGKTQRERVEREVGGGIGMGNTFKPMAVSFQCMTKFTTNKKN